MNYEWIEHRETLHNGEVLSVWQCKVDGIRLEVFRAWDDYTRRYRWQWQCLGIPSAPRGYMDGVLSGALQVCQQAHASLTTIATT